MGTHLLPSPSTATRRFCCRWMIFLQDCAQRALSAHGASSMSPCVLLTWCRQSVGVILERVEPQHFTRAKLVSRRHHRCYQHFPRVQICCFFGLVNHVIIIRGHGAIKHNYLVSQHRTIHIGQFPTRIRWKFRRSVIIKLCSYNCKSVKTGVKNLPRQY